MPAIRLQPLVIRPAQCCRTPVQRSPPAQKGQRGQLVIGTDRLITRYLASMGIESSTSAFHLRPSGHHRSINIQGQSPQFRFPDHLQRQRLVQCRQPTQRLLIKTTQPATQCPRRRQTRQSTTAQHTGSDSMYTRCRISSSPAYDVSPSASYRNGISAFTRCLNATLLYLTSCGLPLWTLSGVVTAR